MKPEDTFPPPWARCFCGWTTVPFAFPLPFPRSRSYRPAHRDFNLMENFPMSEHSKSVEKFNVHKVHVSIWENEGVKGAFRTATFQLRYKDGDNHWQTGSSFGTSDLEDLARAATEARERIQAWNNLHKPAV
jgi:hypothetical protein